MKPNHILTTVLLILSFIIVQAAENGVMVQINLSVTPMFSNHVPDEERNPGHRLPSRCIPCIISEVGVSFQTNNTPEIQSYEIAGMEGEVIASFGDETSFIQTLFSLTGDYIVIFNTEMYEYRGYKFIDHKTHKNII